MFCKSELLVECEQLKILGKTNIRTPFLFFPKERKIVVLERGSSKISVYNIESRLKEEITVSSVSSSQDIEISNVTVIRKCSDKSFVFLHYRSSIHTHVIIQVYSLSGSLLHVFDDELTRTYSGQRYICSLSNVGDGELVGGCRNFETFFVNVYEKEIRKLSFTNFKEEESKIVLSKLHPNCVFINTYNIVDFSFASIVIMFDFMKDKKKKEFNIILKGDGSDKVSDVVTFVNKKNQEILITSSNIPDKKSEKYSQTIYSLHFFSVETTELLKCVCCFDSGEIGKLRKRQLCCSSKNSYLFLGGIERICVYDLENLSEIKGMITRRFDKALSAGHIFNLVLISEKEGKFEFLINVLDKSSMVRIKVIGLRTRQDLEESDLKERISYFLNDMDGRVSDMSSLRIDFSLRNISFSDFPKILFY